MAKASVSDNKNKTGRPATGVGTLVGVRLSPAELDLLDLWIAANGTMSRPEALRRILKLMAIRFER